MISMGLDVSTKTGLVMLNDSGEVLVATVLTAPKGSTGLSRASILAGKMNSILGLHTPDIVVVENYGYANTYTLATLVEIGTVLRYFLLQRGLAPKLVAPNGLKKYVLGVGTGKKDQVRLGVFKRWGFENKSDEIVDAYGLAQVGLGILFPANTNKAQQEVISKVSQCN